MDANDPWLEAEAVRPPFQTFADYLRATHAAQTGGPSDPRLKTVAALAPDFSPAELARIEALADALDPKPRPD